MRVMKIAAITSIFGAAAITGASIAAPVNLDVVLAHGSQAELKTRANLLALAKNYPLSRWTWTKRVIIEQYSIPHSDPVLTLNTRSEGLVLLSSYVHEQLHRFEDLHENVVNEAVAEFKRSYPNLPAGPPDGAKDLDSTYLHIITCYSEYQAMKQLVGPAQAKAVITGIGLDHYRAVYRLVLDHEAAIGAVVNRYGLMPS